MHPSTLHRLAFVVIALATLLAPARSGETPKASPSASPRGPLRVERATHVANPVTFGSESPRFELHGEVVVRNAGSRPVTQVKLTAHLIEECHEYPLGTLAPGQSGTVEWSLTRLGADAIPVELEVVGAVDGRQVKLGLQSREVVPPSRNTPGAAPPGY